VAQWKNDQWSSITLGLDTPTLSLPTGLVVIDDTLHMLGWFDTVGTQVIHKWALWDGTQWSPADTVNFINQTQISAKYQGDYYVGGNFEIAGVTHDIARRHNGHWEALGPGLLGDPWVDDMVVYDGLLWVAGVFDAAAGNAATGLMAWDGQHWLNPFPQVNIAIQCVDLSIINGKLYFSAFMNVAGLTGQYHIGVYDGHSLCIIGGPDVYVLRLTGSPDTLYAQACQYTCLIGGIHPYGIAKWPLNAPPDTCFDVWLGVHENAQGQGAITIYPDPATSEVSLSYSGNDACSLQVMDMLGRPVMRSGYTRSSPVNVSTLAPGTYTLRLFDTRGVPVGVGRFVKE
jgi:hypothetical protein